MAATSYHQPEPFLDGHLDDKVDDAFAIDERETDDSHEHETYDDDDDLEEGMALIDETDEDYVHRRRRRVMIVIAAAGFFGVLLISTIIGVSVSKSKKASAPPPVAPSNIPEPTAPIDINNTTNEEITTTEPTISVPDAPSDLYSNCMSTEPKFLLSCQQACFVGQCCYSKDTSNCFAQFSTICSDYEVCKFADFTSLDGGGDASNLAYAETKPVTSSSGAYYEAPEDFKIAQPDVVEIPPVSGYGTMDSSGMLPGLGGGPEIKSIDIEKLCNSESYKTNTGKKGCTEACKARQCCFGTEAENCVVMYPPQYCKGYSEVCLILKLDTEATTAAPEEVVVDPESLMETTKTVALDGMAQVSPADAYCEEDQMNTKEERDKCQAACDTRACCFSDGSENCATMFPQDCAEYTNCNNLYAKLNELENAANAPPPLTPEEQFLNATATTQALQEYYTGVTQDKTGNGTDSATESFLAACSDENLSRGAEGETECMSVCNTRSCCFATDNKINCEIDHADWCAEFRICKTALGNDTSYSEPDMTDDMGAPVYDNQGPSVVDLPTVCVSDKTVSIDGAIKCSNACSQKSCCGIGSCKGDPQYCEGYDEFCLNSNTLGVALQLSAQPEEQTAVGAMADPTMSPTQKAAETSAPTLDIPVPPDILSVCDPSQLNTVEGYDTCEVACSPAKCCNDNDSVECDQRVCIAFTICQKFWAALSPADIPPDTLGSMLDNPDTQQFSNPEGATQSPP